MKWILRLILVCALTGFVMPAGFDGYCQESAPAEEPAAEAPESQTPPSPTPPSESAAQPAGQGFEISGGAGTAFVNGSIGTSPALSLACIGIEKDPGYHVRGTYPIPILAAGGDARVVVDYFGFNFTGSKQFGEDQGGWTSGQSPPYHGIAPGDWVEGRLQISMALVSVDMAVPVFSAGALGDLKLGPRLQWFSYHDTMRVQNHGGSGITMSDQQFEQTRNYSMFGLGLVGYWRVPAVIATFVPTGFAPAVRFSAGAGQGRDMRFQSYEGFVEFNLGMFSRLLDFGMRQFSSGSPNLVLQAGIVQVNILETRDDIGFPGPPGPIGDPYASDRADYRVRYPEVRLALSF